MRVNVNGGHTRRAPGASGHLDELAEDRLVKDALLAELRSRGHEVSDSTTDEATATADLRAQAGLANASGAQVAVSVHFNAGGGTGAEVWHYPGSCEGLAADMSARVASALGLPDRGAKASSALYWLRATSMPAVLVEVCFVDSAADAAAYRAAGPAAVARAVADALDGGSSAEPGEGEALEADGWWGPATTAALQRALGCVADGEVWHQWPESVAAQPALAGGWSCDRTLEGSPAVRALQAALGMPEADRDGLFGARTATALQLRLGLVADGVLDGPSPAVAEMQRRLAAGTLF